MLFKDWLTYYWLCYSKTRGLTDYVIQRLGDLLTMLFKDWVTYF